MRKLLAIALSVCGVGCTADRAATGIEELAGKLIGNAAPVPLTTTAVGAVLSC
ncbi:MAG TPA: hypothetical protein QF409_03265 [Acidimicrobiales bacterium]|jgi:hypothetical protein|nr:hypothetical protein [Acidimicrobiales bacterium]